MALQSEQVFPYFFLRTYFVDRSEENSIESSRLHQFFFLVILNDKEICNLQEVEYIRKIPGHPAVPVKSPLRELIKIRLTLLLILKSIFVM